MPFIGSAQVQLSLTSSNTTCNYANGYIYASGSLGNSPYTFSINGGPFQNRGLFTGLSSGSYSVTVRDSRGATASKSVTLTNMYNHPTFNIMSSIVPDCGSFDGSVTLNVGGAGVAPYTYSSDGVNFQASSTLGNLSPGAYNLRVKDANGCLVAGAFTFPTNCPVTLQTSGPACGPEGSVTVTPKAGSTLPFTYSLDGTAYRSQNEFDQLSPGMYHIYAKDATGNITITSFIISAKCSLPVTATTTVSTCASKSGSITVSSGGTPPLFYSVLGGDLQPSNVISNLAPGTYTISVADATGNTGILAGVVVGQYCPTLNVTSSPAGCASNNGTITVSGATGNPPITYSIDGVSFQSSTTFSGLKAGDYTVTSKDAGGVLVTADVSVGVAAPPDLNLTTTSSGCTVANGSIVATASNGLTPYSYSLNNGTLQNSGAFSGLSAGSYEIEVKDGNGCTATKTVKVPVASAPTITLQTTPSACSVNNGSIQTNVSGGAAPYSFQLNGEVSQVNGNFTGLMPATYTVKVQDANGCVAGQTTKITTAQAPNLNATTSNSTCVGNDGTITASGIGVGSPFTFSIDGSPFQPSGVFQRVASGPHDITVKDANGCTNQSSYTVGLTNTIEVSAGNDLAICKGDSIRLLGSSSASAVWSPSATLSNANSLQPKAAPSNTQTYVLTAKEGICVKADSMVLQVNTLPTPNAGPDQIVCSGQSTKLTGTGGILYMWTPSSFLDNDHISTPTVSNPSQSITFQLNVVDGNGCKSIVPDNVTVTVTPPPKLSAGNDTNIVAGQTLRLNAINLSNADFVKFTWSPTSGLDNPNSPDPLTTLSTSQTYVLTGTTAAGCVGTDEINIKVFEHADLYVPNAFTPNNDGVNDIIRAIPVGIKTFERFSIFNRYGQLVFDTKDSGKGWDGKVDNMEQNTGGYVWQAMGIDFTGKTIQRQGIVVLIR